MAGELGNFILEGFAKPKQHLRDILMLLATHFVQVDSVTDEQARSLSLLILEKASAYLAEGIHSEQSGRFMAQAVIGAAVLSDFYQEKARVAEQTTFMLDTTTLLALNAVHQVLEIVPEMQAIGNLVSQAFDFHYHDGKNGYGEFKPDWGTTDFRLAYPLRHR